MRAVETYLQRCGRRLRLRWLARWGAITAVTVLALSAAATALIVAVVPTGDVLLALRMVLLAAVVVAVTLALRRTWTPGRIAAEVEDRVPQFAGRLNTWVDNAWRQGRSDLFVLLDRETGAVAAGHSPERTVPARDIAVPALVAVAALGLLSAAFTGNGPWQVAAQRLLTGELLGTTRPRIAIEPGDAVVRRGSDVVIEARAEGFAANVLELSAAFGGGGWERAAMTATGGGGHSFVLVGVAEPVEYYVTGQGVSSARHRLAVADLPSVTAVETHYRFPAWTGRAPEQRSGGDVAALSGTGVGVQVTTDTPVQEAVLVVGEQTRPLRPAADAAEAVLSGGFDVTAPGSWHVAVPHEGRLARISDVYLVDVIEDAAPEVAYVWPGHDRKATPIEEVALQFEATDDVGVEALVLRYAVNGGDWQDVALGEQGSHVLRLENLRAAGADGPRALRPGDVVSLYAEARDHAQRTRSSLYFVDVRPFEMRYRESQQMSGSGGAEGGGFDIAERQRDILTATWNLVNDAADKSDDAVADEADVLAMLQQTLEQQVRTLLTRAAARGLGQEDDVSAFIDSLSRAAAHMPEAAERLAERDYEGAVGPEQQALRHLIAAESSVREVDVSLSRRDGRGTSGQSLGELVELEMDPERNRYEMPQQADLQAQSGARDEEAWQRLDELASRQERLARRRAGDADTLPMEWEQARLRRELEEVRQALAAEGGASVDGGGGGAARSRALERLDRAGEALDRDGADPTERQRAAEALRSAADTLRAAGREDIESRIARASRQVENLRSDQARVMEALEALQEDALERAREGQQGLGSDFSMQTFADTKRRMNEDVARLRGELTSLGAALDERSSEGAVTLNRALDELDAARLDERLAGSAEAFDLGQPLYVIGSESVVDQALERLERRLAQTRRSLEGSGFEQADPAARLRALRQRLDTAGGGADVDRPAVEAVVRDLARLGRDAGLPGPGAGDSAADGRAGGRYAIRGTAAENDAALLVLARERLDLMEAALATRSRTSVRAQEPRSPARDSAAAARYFRELSRGTGADPR